MIDDEVSAYLPILDVTVGRVNVTQSRFTSYYYCRKPGCGKGFRVVQLSNVPADYAHQRYYLEHDEREEHDHTAVDLNLRGLSDAQKAIVLWCLERQQTGAKSIIREFERLARLQIAANLNVVPTPPTTMINSFLCYHRLQERGGIPVGQTSLEDLEAFANQRPFGE
jgi:hypothetical protein